MVYADLPLLKVQILHSQSAELTDPHAGAQQHQDLVVILAVVIVMSDEVQKLLLLFFRESYTLLGIVGEKVKTEIERIPPDDLFREGHLEGRPQHTTDESNGVPGITVVKKLDKPFLCVADLDTEDGFLGKVVLLQHTYHKHVTRLGGIPADERHAPAGDG